MASILFFPLLLKLCNFSKIQTPFVFLCKGKRNASCVLLEVVRLLVFFKLLLVRAL